MVRQHKKLMKKNWVNMKIKFLLKMTARRRKSVSSISVLMKKMSKKRNKNHAIGIAMSASNLNGKCKTLNYMAMTKRTFKAEWIISMSKNKVKVGIRIKRLIIK